MGSTSTGSIEPTTQCTDLSRENEKLKKDNEKLGCELARAKKQCDELVGFLRDTFNVGPDQINRIIREGTSGSSHDTVRFDDDDIAVGECECEEGEKLKLFGVWLKSEEGKENAKITNGKSNCRKRGREDTIGGANNELNTVV